MAAQNSEIAPAMKALTGLRSGELVQRDSLGSRIR
jgi:hypothetical protein